MRALLDGRLRADAKTTAHGGAADAHCHGHSFRCSGHGSPLTATYSIPYPPCQRDRHSFANQQLISDADQHPITLAYPAADGHAIFWRRISQ